MKEDGLLRVVRDNGSLELTMPSDLTLVNSVVARVRLYCEKQGVSDSSLLILAARELIHNAVVHGNESQAQRTVRVCVDRREGDRFRLAVEDQGDGFDHGACDLCLTDISCETARRGLSLVNAHCDSLDFELGGARVVACMDVPVRCGFEEDLDESWKVVRPKGDITADKAQAFRDLLFKIKGSGYQKYRFDMACVDIVDSIALSVFVVFANSLQDDSPNTKLELVNVGREVRRLFEMTCLDKKYRIAMEGRDAAGK